MRRLSLLAGFAVITACSSGSAGAPTYGGVAPAPAPKPAAGRAGATRAEISAADLRTRSFIFSDDSMGGRQAGTPANARGNAYIAAEARRIGLTPAGDGGSFLQRVPLVRHVVDSSTQLQAGSMPLTLFSDYYPFQPSFAVPVRPIDGAQIVFAGAGGESPALGADQSRGKVVVLASRTGGTAGIGSLGPDGPYAQAAGVVITGVDPLLSQVGEMLEAPQTALPTDEVAPAGATQPRILFVPTATVSRLFGKPLEQLRPGDAGPTLRGDVRYREEEPDGSNVVAVLPGSDPALRGEYVALGAHNDAIGAVAPVEHDSLRAFNAVLRRQGMNAPAEPATEAATARVRALQDSLRRVRPARWDSIVNGADDDGSGSMALLEIAEAAAAATPRPKRSLLFVWHTGEEAGLLGSRWFTEHPTVPRDSIVAQVNIDMIGRGEADDVAGGGPRQLQLIGARRLSTELGTVVEETNQAQPQPFDLDYQYDAPGHADQIYCRSDHYMYARFGIPIVFFTTGVHRDYHQVTDEPQYLAYAKYAAVTRYIGDLVGRVANLDHRLVVDQPKPDPNGSCQQ